MQEKQPETPTPVPEPKLPVPEKEEKKDGKTKTRTKEEGEFSPSDNWFSPKSPPQKRRFTEEKEEPRKDVLGYQASFLPLKF